MKKKILLLVSLFFIIHCSLFINPCKADWVQTNGMDVFTVYSITGNSNYLFAGTQYSGIYRSTNNGLNWTQTSLNNVSVYGLVFSGNTTYAGVLGGVYISNDNGNTWNLSPINTNTVFSLAASGNNIFAGTGSGVYLSTNNGINWVQIGLNNKFVGSIITDGSNIFAGTDSYGVYNSTNNGANWIQTTLNDKSVYSLAIIGNRIFAGTSVYGVYVSTNNGVIWSQTALNNQDVWALSISGNNLFAGTLNNGGVFLSTNFGMNWIQKNQGFSTVPSVPSLFVYNNYIFAGTQGYNVWRRLISDILSINKISTAVPDGYNLYQNYPNPFNPVTKIKFDIQKTVVSSKYSVVTLKVFDILGKEIQTLVNEKLEPGTYEVTFVGRNLPSGNYFYKLTAGEYIKTNKMILK